MAPQDNPTAGNYSEVELMLMLLMVRLMIITLEMNQ